MKNINGEKQVNFIEKHLHKHQFFEAVCRLYINIYCVSTFLLSIILLKYLKWSKILFYENVNGLNVLGRETFDLDYL